MTLRRIPLPAALLLLAAGFTGDAFPVFPAGHVDRHSSAAAWSPAANAYVVVNVVRTDLFRGYRTDLQSRIVDAQALPELGGITALNNPDDVDPVNDQPSISWNPSSGRFLLVYRHNAALDAWAGQIVAKVLDGNGVPTGPSPTKYLLVSPKDDHKEIRPVLTCDGHDWMIAWESAGRIEARKVPGSADHEATLASPVVLLSEDGTIDNHDPAIDAVGGPTGALVAWRQDNGGATILGRTLPFDGGAPGPIQRYDDTVAGLTYGSAPAVAADPVLGAYVVAWVQGKGKPVADGDPVFRHAAGNGSPLETPVVLDANPLHNARMDGMAARYVPAARQYWLAWFEDPTDPVAGGLHNDRVRAACLSAFDLSIRENGLIVDETPDDQAGRAPTLAAGSQAEALTLWTQNSGMEGGNPVMARVFTLDVATQPEVDPSPSPSPVVEGTDGGGGKGGCLGSAAGGAAFVAFACLLALRRR